LPIRLILPILLISNLISLTIRTVFLNSRLTLPAFIIFDEDAILLILIFILPLILPYLPLTTGLQGLTSSI